MGALFMLQFVCSTGLDYFYMFRILVYCTKVGKGAEHGYGLVVFRNLGKLKICY